MALPTFQPRSVSPYPSGQPQAPQLDMPTIMVALKQVLSQPRPPQYDPAAPDPNLPGAQGVGNSPPFPPNSALGQLSQLNQDAASGPNVFDQQAAQGASQAAGATAQQGVLDSVKPNPKDFTWDNYTPQPYPTRESVPIPERQPARTDPMASILAAIAGFIAPREAGQFGAAPLQAGQAVADQNYKDAITGYEMRNAAVSQAFGDAISKRADQQNTDLYNRAGADKAAGDLSEAQLKYAGMAAPVAGAAAEGNAAATQGATLGDLVRKAGAASGMAATIQSYQAYKQSQSKDDQDRFEEDRKSTLTYLQHMVDKATEAGDKKAQQKYQDAILTLRGMEVGAAINKNTDDKNLNRAKFDREGDKIARSPENDPYASPLLKTFNDEVNAAKHVLVVMQNEAQNKYDALSKDANFKQAYPDSQRWQSTRFYPLITAKADYDAALARREARRTQLNFNGPNPTTPSGNSKGTPTSTRYPTIPSGTNWGGNIGR
jgi:hypothetical protein